MSAAAETLILSAGAWSKKLAFLSLNCVSVYSFFPKGNNVDYLSMYLEVADSASLPYGWSIYAQFSLTVVNQIMNKYSVRKGNTTVLLICDCPNSLRRGYEDGLDSKRWKT
ncbi:ubiquitin-specific protease [Trifolium repens]|nr:ubiquitin-specific protease [Trifolium repens]